MGVTPPLLVNFIDGERDGKVERSEKGFRLCLRKSMNRRRRKLRLQVVRILQVVDHSFAKHLLYQRLFSRSQIKDRHVHSHSAMTPVRAQFVHSRGQNVGIGAERNPLSLSQSKKKLVNVTGIEPVTPCLQSSSG